MRKLLLFTCLLLLFPTASSASFSLFASYWDTSEVGDAWGGGLRLGFGVLPFTEIEIAGTYMEEFEQTVEIGRLGRLEGKLEAIPIDAGLRLDFGLPFGLYFAAGGSFFLLDSDRGDLDDEFGLYGAAGIVLFNRLFIEVMYRLVEGTFESLDLGNGLPDIIVREEIEVDLGGVALNVGLRF